MEKNLEKYLISSVHSLDDWKDIANKSLKDSSIEDLNNKGNLNEFCSIKNFNQPKYTIIKDSGPAHRIEYKVLLVVDSMSFFGEGYKIKDAENMAALKALKYFNFFSLFFLFLNF